MASITIREVEGLDPGYILAPERYDPRRNPTLLDFQHEKSQRLGHLITVARPILNPEKADTDRQYLILDTGDVRNGFISIAKEPVVATAIGSAKKILHSGEVIISRLRPYLRQVGWVDSELAQFEDATPAASTEFYVLRSPGPQSIAFLVPYLLSEEVQKILAASQEGGHHPRFPEKALVSLLVPDHILERREELSKMTEAAVNKARASEIELRDAVRIASTF